MIRKKSIRGSINDTIGKSYLIIYCILCIQVVFSLNGCQKKSDTNAAAEPKEQIDFVAEKVKIEKAIDGYAKTYETESEALLSEVMAHDEDRVSLGTDEDEYYVGYQRVLDQFRMQFGRLEETTVYVNKREVKIHESGEVAWFIQVWDMRTTAAGSKNFDQGMRLSGVLEKRDNKWVIVQFHNSFPRKH